MSGLMGLGQLAPMANPYPLGQVAPLTKSDSPSAFFVRLLNALEFDFARSAVLYALLIRQADLGFVKASKRDLSAALGCCLSDRHVWRALNALESLGFIESKSRRNTTTAYRVLLPALLDLLATPLSEAEVIPGLTPLPALDRIFAGAGVRPTLNEGNHDGPRSVR